MYMRDWRYKSSEDFGISKFKIKNPLSLRGQYGLQAILTYRLCG